MFPAEVSARYVLHIREAWNQEMGNCYLLENRQVILTVPASLDEVARELTGEVAEQAGLTNCPLRRTSSCLLRLAGGP